MSLSKLLFSLITSRWIWPAMPQAGSRCEWVESSSAQSTIYEADYNQSSLVPQVSRQLLPFLFQKYTDSQTAIRFLNKNCSLGISYSVIHNSEFSVGTRRFCFRPSVFGHVLKVSRGKTHPKIPFLRRRLQSIWHWRKVRHGGLSEGCTQKIVNYLAKYRASRKTSFRQDMINRRVSSSPLGHFFPQIIQCDKYREQINFELQLDVHLGRSKHGVTFV